MPNYRLVFSVPDATGQPIAAMNFTARDAGEALILAQQHDGPSELWEDDAHLCTLRRSGKSGQFWIISGSGQPRESDPAHTGPSTRARQPG